MLSDEALTTHLAGVLAAAGIGVLEPPGTPLIAAKRLPVEPDVAIAITVYLATDSLMENTRRAQFRYRGAPNDPFGPDRLADQVFGLLHMRHTDGVIARIRRESMAPLGVDGNVRDERTDNYEIILRPERALP